METNDIGENGMQNGNIFIPNAEKGERYHKEWLEYFMRNYFFKADPFNKFQLGGNRFGTEGTTFGFGYYEYYMDLYRYAMGVQNSNYYSFVTQDLDNSDVLGYNETGKQMKYMFDCIRGIFSDFIGKMELNVISLSKNDTILKDTVKKQLMLYVSNPDLQDLFNSIGMLPTVIKMFKGTTTEDVELFMKDFNLESEGQMLAIAKNIIYINEYVILFDRCLLDVLSTGRCTIKPTIYNGSVRLERKNPMFIGYDTTTEDPFLRRQNYCLEYRAMTAQEIFSEYDLTPAQKLELLELNETMPLANQTYSFSYFIPYVELNGVRKFTVIEAQWTDCIELSFVDSYIGQSNSREFKLKDIYSNYSSTQLKKRTDKQEITEYKKTTRTCVMIGNQIVCNYGPKKNQVNVKSNSWETNIDYLSFIPDLTMGDNISFAEICRPFQDKIDLYLKKIIDLVAKDKGFILKLDSISLPDGVNKFDVLNDVIRHQIIETNVAGIERPELLNTHKELIEILDLNLNFNSFREYTNAIEQETLNMGRAISLYPALIQTVSNLNSANAIIEPPSMATIGLKPLLKGFTQYLNRVIQYSCNLAKIGLTANGDYESIIPLSKNDVFTLSLSKEMAFDDFQFHARIDDGISASKEKLLMDVVFASAQNGKLDVQDIFPILKNYSPQEMEAEFNLREYRKMKQIQKDQQAKQQMADSSQQQKDSASERITQQQMEMNRLSVEQKDKAETERLQFDKQAKVADIALKDKELNIKHNANANKP